MWKRRCGRLSERSRTRPLRVATSGIVADLLVDTDVFIDHLRGARPLRFPADRIHYSVITGAELLSGRRGIRAVPVLLAPFREIPVDRQIAERAGEIRRGIGLRLPDALIAATALTRGMPLATRNRRDFTAVPNLTLVAPGG